MSKLVIAGTFLVVLIGCCNVRAEEEVEFRAFVQSSYRFRANLDAWENSAQLLTSALRSSFQIQVAPEVLVDRDSSDLIQILSTPSKRPNATKVLYLAAHMSAGGDISFSNGDKLSPDEIASNVTTGSWAPDILIIDTCHAAVFSYMEIWKSRFPGMYLFAADTNQIAWEIDLNAKQPFNVSGNYPELIPKTKQVLGKEWDGTLSDLGYRAAKMTQLSSERYQTAEQFVEALALMPKDKARNKRLSQSTLIRRDY